MRRSWLTRILTHRVSRKPTLGGTGVRRWVQNLPGVVRGAVGANSGRTGPHSALDLPLSARVLSPAGVCTERASTMPTTGRMRVPKTGAGCMRSGKPVRVSWVRMCRAGLMGSGRALRVHGVRVRGVGCMGSDGRRSRSIDHKLVRGLGFLSPRGAGSLDSVEVRGLGRPVRSYRPLPVAPLTLPR